MYVWGQMEKVSLFILKSENGVFMKNTARQLY